MSFKTVILILLLIAFLSIYGHNRDYLSGQVSLYGGNGSVEDVNIYLDDYYTNPDSTGYFDFYPVPTAIYELTAELDGYEVFQTNVDLEEISYIEIEMQIISPYSLLNLTAEIITFNDVYLTWIDSLDTENVIGFEIYRDSVLINEISDPAISEYYDYALDQNLYFYCVVAIIDSLDPIPSNIEYLYINLPYPTNLTYTFNPPSQNIVLQWHAPEMDRDLQGYNVYRDDEIIAAVAGTFYLEVPPPIWTYYYVTAVYDGDYESAPSNMVDNPMGLNDNSLPEYTTKLLESYPNPFNPITNISYSLAQDDFIDVSIYNVKGQQVLTVVNRFQSKGFYTLIWDGTNHNDRVVDSGIYFICLKTKDITSFKKCILLK